MNATALVALLAFHAPAHDDDVAAAPRARDERAVLTCPADVVAAFDSVDAALRQAERSLEGRKRVGDARSAIREAQERNHRARIVACREARQPDVVIVQPPPPAPRVIVLDERGHEQLVGVVRREAFDDGRLSVLSLGVRDVCVTSAQARSLVRELTFSTAQLDAIRVLAARIVDREQSYVLLESLTFDSDKQKARALLMSSSPAPECVIVRR